LIVVPCFSRNYQHSVFEQLDQTLSFLRADDPRVCVTFDLLNVLLDQVLHS
jgi:hypothetical protein